MQSLLKYVFPAVIFIQLLFKEVLFLLLNTGIFFLSKEWKLYWKFLPKHHKFQNKNADMLEQWQEHAEV